MTKCDSPCPLWHDPFGYCSARESLNLHDFHFAGFVARIGLPQPVWVLNGRIVLLAQAPTFAAADEHPAFG